MLAQVGIMEVVRKSGLAFGCLKKKQSSDIGGKFELLCHNSSKAFVFLFSETHLTATRDRNLRLRDAVSTETFDSSPSSPALSV